jgi:S-adenosylmethionine synthetase
MRDFVMTSDAVTAGHPDKLCDQISDAVVDAWLCESGRAGVNAECALASGVAFLSIRSGSDVSVDAAALARRVVEEAGYDPAEGGAAMTVLLELSRDPSLSPGQIGTGVARHMVTAFGYACEGSATATPAPIESAHRLATALDAARRDGRLGWLRPDAKAQVAVRYADRRPIAIEAVAMEVRTLEELTQETVETAIRTELVGPVLASCDVPLAEGARLSVIARPGPAGPAVHTGLTGRKTADDGYGSFVRQSGSALSGKDPSRIDRIADYAARHAACGIVSAGLARECEVQLSYVPGQEDAYDVEVDTYGSGALPDADICKRLREVADLRVAAIAERFRLWDLPKERGGAFYRHLAVYGQVGRDDMETPWDAPTLAHALA